MSMSTPTPYAPSPELSAHADAMITNASAAELQMAARAYTAYGSVTGGRSAVTGAELPTFDACKPLVRAGWLATVRELTAALVLATPVAE
ncbi:hypothetical protein OV208_15290 [Corallococcus sp. bb12-1]|uniref:hypothetical protein n=1 Tax=Corallococcus sp. bb12-1 TaxID=2996784 RepID=UPI00226D4433|nr:hypothetical protein [Corallococcus sp. bb12-1]MCY1042688.1 hypothetical protein [Corallococcus sp. bb12-1]